MVADGAGGGEGGVVVGLGCPKSPRVFLTHEVGIVAMLADVVTTFAWNHRADDGIEAVGGEVEEDAFVCHHSHDVRPRPIFLFRGDFLVYLADNFDESPSDTLQVFSTRSRSPSRISASFIDSPFAFT